MINHETLKGLKKEIPFKWKVQTQSNYDGKGKVTCVGYIDARQAQDLLDDVVGPENWKVSFNEKFGQLFCTVSINCNGEWVSKEDVGVESMTEKEKGQVSDAFKRACVHWGIGRFLYSLDMVKLNSSVSKDGRGRDRHTPLTNEGTKLFGGDQLTNYINKLKGHSPKTATQGSFNSSSSKQSHSNKSAATVENRAQIEEIKPPIPMPPEFKEKFLSNNTDKEQPANEGGFKSGDSEIDQILEGLLVDGSLNEEYLEANKPWLLSLPKPRKARMFNLIPEQFKSRVVELLNK